MIVVYKVSPNIKPKIMEYYKGLKRPITPPYAVFQAEEGGTIITLYESDKIMFQGTTADVDAGMWFDLEYHFNKRDVRRELLMKEKEKLRKNVDVAAEKLKDISTIGSDEVGTGDYFGPIVVTAAYVDIKTKTHLQELGVKDSKRLTDEKIREIAPILIKEIPHCTFIISAKEYNEQGIFNMNKVKAILHNKVLSKLVSYKKFKYEAIVVDEFVYPKKYYEHIANIQDKVTNISFTTHAESKCLSVAVASIISRYTFLKEMDKLSAKYKFNIPKGAGYNVDDMGAELCQKYGIKILGEIAKINFKNTEKIKEKLGIKKIGK